MPNSTFEVRSYIGNELRDTADSYLDAAAKASKLANEEQAAFVVNEIVRRCILTPTKLVKEAK